MNDQIGLIKAGKIANAEAREKRAVEEARRWLAGEPSYQDLKQALDLIVSAIEWRTEAMARRDT